MSAGAPQVTLQIDGKEVTVPKGTTVIQAAEKLDIFIPRYCYHPGLSIAGNCRICLVEIEGQRKLQIACNTPAADGMKVSTRSEATQQGRKTVLEFLLANHPLDCPVCDQAGECDLQNYYMAYGRYDPRFEELKVKKPKAVALGPTVMLDAERCILCSRCERFTDEVTKTGEFGIFNRGDRAEIGIYPGKALSNPYSGNVVDLCPVGALTDRDFRFKARVWYLQTSPSVCNGCSKGCNIDIHFVTDRPYLAEGARVMRLKPRYNAEVNRWWMCDEGRYGYKFIDKKRLLAPAERGAERTWEAALTGLAGALQDSKGRAAFLPSQHLTVEELFLIRQVAEALQAACTSELPYRPGSRDDLLIRPDKTPNRAGCRLLGLEEERPADREDPGKPALEVLERALAGEIELLWVFGHDLAKAFGEEKARQVAERVKYLVFQGTNENSTSAQARWVLPGAVYAEKEGVFVNGEGRAQRISQAFEPIGQARADWKILLEVAQRLHLGLSYGSPGEIFTALGETVPAFAGLSYEKLGGGGCPVVRGAAHA